MIWYDIDMKEAIELAITHVISYEEKRYAGLLAKLAGFRKELASTADDDPKKVILERKISHFEPIIKKEHTRLIYPESGEI